MSNLTDADREALGRIIWETSRADESTISYAGANIVADAVLVSDWFQARVAEAKDQALENGKEICRQRNRAKKAERERNEAREALARVEALADEWERESPVWLDPVGGPVTELRAALRGGDA